MLAPDLSEILGIPIRIARHPHHLSPKYFIQVPRKEPEAVRLQPLLENEEFCRSGSPLWLSLGVRTNRRPFFIHLESMPHLLVGGGRGSGKSLALQAMILSLIRQANPDRLRLLLIDLKGSTPTAFSNLPHLLTPVIRDPSHALSALAWAADETEKRPGESKHPPEMVVEWGGTKLETQEPSIVLVIDETAGLARKNSDVLEDCLIRLVDGAQCAGIHLICATDSLSVNVFSAAVKAKFACRATFKVGTVYESIAMLDATDAELLLPRGDMLLQTAADTEPIRLHMPELTECDVVSAIKASSGGDNPGYLENILTHPWPPVQNGEDRTDPLYDQVVRFVVHEQIASINSVQRRFAIGYVRAARLLESLERNGLIEMGTGSKKREVLVALKYFDSHFGS